MLGRYDIRMAATFQLELLVVVFGVDAFCYYFVMRLVARKLERVEICSKVNVLATLNMGFCHKSTPSAAAAVDFPPPSFRRA